MNDSPSRRDRLAAGTTLADPAAGASALRSPAALAPGAAPRPPFDTLRDYVAALEAHGLLLRIPQIDQDAYEATGLVYRANDLYGFDGVPAMLFERVKINGKWVEGPVLNLLQSNLACDAIVLGEPVTPEDPKKAYRRTKARYFDMLKQNKGAYPQIPPVTVARERALCKEIVLKADDIDLTTFAFLQTNPSDAGRYINATAVFTDDPVLGRNFGTYRCQLKGPRLIGLNPEEGQAGWKALMAAKQRGDQFAKVAIALGQDPVVWFVSCTRVVPRFSDKPVDEIAAAGGLRGKALEMVKCETSDLMVPASCEMIIEGEVPLQVPGMPEGPFGEMFGYMGAQKQENFFVNVTCVTHRRDPWVVNMYTGLQRGMVTAASDALSDYMLRQSMPWVLETYIHQDTMGIYVVSIDKTAAGQGMKTGMSIARFVPIAKMVIVVDKDIDVMDRREILFAMGSRFQSLKQLQTMTGQRGLITDPSLVDRQTDKLIIDVTRQLPEEGGREAFPSTNRALLEKAVPDVFAAVDQRFGEMLKKWGSLGRV